MKTLLTWFALVSLVALVGASPVLGCPLCKEAIQAPESSDGGATVESDPVQEARAWNNSIYLMVAMPYLLVGGVGLLIYRSVRKAQAQIVPGPAPSSN